MNTIDIAFERGPSPFLRFLDSLLTWKKVALVLLLSAAAVSIMQIVIVSNTDIEGYLRTKATEAALTEDAVEQLVAKQLEQVRYAPFMSLLVWPVLLSLGAAVFVGVLVLLDRRARTQPWAAWQAFAVAIGLAYFSYASLASLYTLATGSISPPFGLDSLYGNDSAAVRAMLQTFDLANLTLAVLAAILVPRSLGIGRRTTLIAVLAVIVGYTAFKGGLVLMTVPKEKPVVCELCEVANSDFPAASSATPAPAPEPTGTDQPD